MTSSRSSALVLLLIAALVVPASPSARATSYVPHAPIAIDGNADFAAQASSEGWPGDGTSASPYILAGFDIVGPAQFGISIHNTDVAFILRDSKAVGSPVFTRGIWLVNVQHVALLANVFGGYQAGIMIDSGDSRILSNVIRDITLEGNDITSTSGNAILLTGRMADMTLQHNTIHDAVNGLSIYNAYFEGSLHAIIANNTIARMAGSGMSISIDGRGIDPMFDIAIRNNTIIASGDGFTVSFTSNTAPFSAPVAGPALAIAGNHATGSTIGRGFSIGRVPGPVVDNVAESNAENGMNVNCFHTYVGRNIARSNLRDGFVITGGDCRVEDDLATQNSRDGYGYGLASQQTWSRDVARDNGQVGFDLGGSGGSYSELLSTHNRAMGFALAISGGTFTLLTANSNGADGILFQRGPALLQNSSSTANARSALWVLYAAGIDIEQSTLVGEVRIEVGSGTLVQGNDISANGSSAISVYSGSTGTTIARNTIHDSDIAVNVYSEADATIRRNVVVDNRVGVLLFGASAHVWDNYFDNTFDARMLEITPTHVWTGSGVGPSIVGGPKIGGNYWARAVTLDLDADGLGEIPVGPVPPMSLPGSAPSGLPIPDCGAVETLTKQKLPALLQPDLHCGVDDTRPLVCLPAEIVIGTLPPVGHCPRPSAI